MTVVETLEALSVASLVLGHFMYGVVDGVEVEFLGALGDAHLVGVGTGFCSHALFEVGLGVPHYVAEEFGKLGCVLGFFKCIALESLGYFGIAFAVGLTRHCKIHTYFGALTHEVCVEVGAHLVVGIFGDADYVLGYKLEKCCLVEFLELGCGHTTLGTLFGSCVAFMNVAADCTDEFLAHFLGNYTIG